MGKRGNNDGDGIHGLCAGKCRHCGERIPENTPACPACGKERLFNQEQYDMLMRCSKAEDMGEWTAWQSNNPMAPIHLEGADLLGAHLEGADLSNAHLEGANLGKAHLEGADLNSAHLEDGHVLSTHLEGADLMGAHLESTVAEVAFVNAQTILWFCTFDRKTDFAGAALEAANIDPALKSVLQRNIRQIGWERWYESNRLRRYVLSIPVRLFWWVSDYGGSTLRIVLWFLVLSGLFGLLYSYCPDLVRDDYGAEVTARVRPIRMQYFSVVTMTTLGFGDLKANPRSVTGHAVLSLHVFLGYVLLGALITRFAIMFQGTTVPYVEED